MPIINVKLTNLPDEAKCQEIISDLTKYFEQKLGKKKERIVVMLEVIKPIHIGFGGVSAALLNDTEFVKNFELDER